MEVGPVELEKQQGWGGGVWAGTGAAKAMCKLLL